MLQVNIEIVFYYGQQRTGYAREERLGWFGCNDSIRNIIFFFFREIASFLSLPTLCLTHCNKALSRAL